jgi:hypothetical protein
MADERTLPGWPSQRLVKDVRRQLTWYGIKPTRSIHLERIWHETWQWANQINQSYKTFDFSKRRREHWPSANEIAAQYVFLLMLQMGTDRALRLPYRAADHTPPALRDRLANGGNPPLQIEG